MDELFINDTANSYYFKINEYVNLCFKEGDAVVQAKNLKNLISFLSKNSINADDLNFYYFKGLLENEKMVKMVESLMDLKDHGVYLGIDFFYYLVVTYNELNNNKYSLDDTDSEYEQFINLNSDRDIDTRKLFLYEIGQYSVYTPEEEKAAFIKYENATGAEKDAIFEDIVTHNMRLVVSIARKYEGRGVSKEDLQQEGSIGLMTAIKRFDVSRNFKFSTYATWWIRQAVSRAIPEYSRNVRMPVHSHEENSKIKRFVATFYQTNGRYPDTDEIANGVELSREKVSFLLSCGDEVSLNAYINGGDGEADTELGEFIVDGRYDEDYNIRQIQLEEFRNFLDNCGLKTRELEVIKKRFGFDDNVPRTLEEVGDEFNVTRERIRQIEAKALRKLSIKLRGSGYRPEDFSLSGSSSYVPTVKRR